MKRFLFLLLLVFIFNGMTGCGQNNSRNQDSVDKSHKNESFMAADISITEDSINNDKNKIIEQGKDSNNKLNVKEIVAPGDKIEENLFSAENYSLLPKLQGAKLNEKKKTVTQKEFLDIIRNPIAFAKISYSSGYGGLVCSRPRILLKYVLPDLESYESDFDNIEINYYDLPQGLSGNLRFTAVEDSVQGSLTSRGLLIDDEKNILLNIKNQNDIETIINAVQWKPQFSLKNIKVLFGYIREGTLKTVLSKDDTVYVIENDTLKLIDKRKTGDWETISGYAYDDNSINKEKNRLFLYQVNNRENRIRKIELLSNTVVYNYPLSNFPAKGEFLKIEHTALDLIYALTKEQEKLKIYSINESLINKSNEVRCTEESVQLGSIEHIWSYNAGRSDSIILFRKNEKYPVKMIYSSDLQYQSVKGNKTANPAQVSVIPQVTAEWGFAMSDIYSGKKPLLNITYKKLIQLFGLPGHIRTYKINLPAAGPDIFEYYYVAEYSGMEIEFYSGYQPKKLPSETDTTIRFDLTGNGPELDCGLKVGMTVREVTDRFGERRIYNLEADQSDTEKLIAEANELNDIKHVLISHKPSDMYNNYQKAMIIYADPDKFDESIKAQALVLLIKESKVDRIVFGYPTAD